MVRITHSEIPIPSAGYSTLDIVKALEIPRERLRDWMNRGFVRPSKPAEGQGSRAVFTKIDVYGIALFQHLLSMGFNREPASEYVHKFVRISYSIDVLSLMYYSNLKDGKRHIHPMVAGPDFNRPKDSIDPGDITLSLVKRLMDGESWEDIQVINITKIKRHVDSMLETLE